MQLGQLGLDLLVGNDAALFQVDEQHLARLQPPFRDDLLFRAGQHAHFRGDNHLVVVGDEIARGPQAVAVERGADHPPIGEGDGGWSVPWLHQRGVIFVECAPLLIHQRVARPGLWNEHHHCVGQRIAALHQEFERIVEAGRIRLPFIGDRPEFPDVLAEQGRGDAGLPRRHPVDVAAQRVDLAIMRDHPIGMRQLPGRKGIGREALMHQRQRRFEARIVQVAVIFAELEGKEHALVHDRPARHRDRIIFGGLPAPAKLVDAIGNNFADQIEPPLESLLIGDVRAAPDKHLPVHRLGGEHDRRQPAIIDRHVAPAEQRLPFRRRPLRR